MRAKAQHQRSRYPEPRVYQIEPKSQAHHLEQSPRTWSTGGSKNQLQAMGLFLVWLSGHYTVTHTMQRASRSKIQHSIPEVDYICFNEHLLCLFTARPKFKGSLAESKFLLAAVYISEVPPAPYITMMQAPRGRGIPHRILVKKMFWPRNE